MGSKVTERSGHQVKDHRRDQEMGSSVKPPGVKEAQGEACCSRFPPAVWGAAVSAGCELTAQGHIASWTALPHRADKPG